MNYFKQTHTQLLIICFFFSSVILVAVPDIDLLVSGLFFDNGFYLKDSWWESYLYSSVPPFLTVSVVTVTVLFFVNRYLDKNIFSIDGRKTLFLIFVLVVGPGLIVNVVFKDHFGRARPTDVIEFNGTKHFTPAFVISPECDKNCSFSSGHGAGAFVALAIALFFKHRKKALAIAFAYGCLVSFARIVAGRHFFSDNVVSFFIVAITTDVLYYLYFVDQLKSKYIPE